MCLWKTPKPTQELRRSPAQFLLGLDPQLVVACLRAHHLGLDVILVRSLERIEHVANHLDLLHAADYLGDTDRPVRQRLAVDVHHADTQSEPGALHLGEDDILSKRV
jgi:hypothetical protein